ncbi:hypothetical protein CTI12_AA095530 [Artemisia annua]|uniref:Uncharacterized protein n=1 Tax=Artemisia annua TaxID=35608 RepID=A0A2U1PZ11_ARTAN|nr:hypothetical protein CTI12_AA095530 [Artemisia annua]
MTSNPPSPPFSPVHDSINVQVSEDNETSQSQDSLGVLADVANEVAASSPSSKKTTVQFQRKRKRVYLAETSKAVSADEEMVPVSAAKEQPTSVPTPSAAPSVEVNTETLTTPHGTTDASAEEIPFVDLSTHEPIAESSSSNVVQEGRTSSSSS